MGSNLDDGFAIYPMVEEAEATGAVAGDTLAAEGQSWRARPRWSRPASPTHDRA